MSEIATPSVGSPTRARLARAVLAARRWVVLAMLLSLHAALVADPGGPFPRMWLLVHCGLFLVWQPFFATERPLAPLAAALVVAITAAMVYFVAGWMVIMWILVLIGILGGRVFTVRAARYHFFYLV